MLAFFSALIAVPLLSSHAVSVPPLRRASIAFVNPLNGGGSLLDNAGNGLGEPLNVIVSALSSPAVLTDSGFLNWAQSVNLSTECFGIHLGDPQSANLGDSNGFVNQTTELRDDFGDANLGTCLETLAGGNHLRLFRQNGPSANTGALFLAVSLEENLAENHTISPNGYDLGRDSLVAAATANGGTTHNGVRYSATSQVVSGLLPAGSQGINHGITIDGNLSLLTITII